MQSESGNEWGSTNTEIRKRSQKSLDSHFFRKTEAGPGEHALKAVLLFCGLSSQLLQRTSCTIIISKHVLFEKQKGFNIAASSN